MPPTTAISDCRRLADAVSAAGGRVPQPLTNILAGADLLKAPSATTNPAKAIVDAAVAGTLTEKRLTDLITTAATTHTVNTYRGDLQRNIEPLMVDAFHTALKTGCADQVLDGLRGSFDTAAEEITAAKDVVPTDAPAEQFLHDATPAAIKLWQQLDGHIATISKIAAIASQFGPRIGPFPLVTEFANSDGFRLEDRALMCCDGNNLEMDSSVFRRPDQGHRTSPWFRIPLRLHSIESAQTRYNEWASGQWERLHAGPPESWIDEHGKMHEWPRPKNPFAQKVSAT